MANPYLPFEEKEATMKEEIKKRTLEAISLIPEGHRTDQAMKEVVRCVLFWILLEHGLRPVPAFRNPRYPEGPADIVGMRADQSIEAAFCSNSTIELEDVKRLDRVLGDNKYIITFSRNPKKVKMSTFYLKPGIEHIPIFEDEEAL